MPLGLGACSLANVDARVITALNGQGLISFFLLDNQIWSYNSKELFGKCIATYCKCVDWLSTKSLALYAPRSNFPCWQAVLKPIHQLFRGIANNNVNYGAVYISPWITKNRYVALPIKQSSYISPFLYTQGLEWIFKRVMPFGRTVIFPFCFQPQFPSFYSNSLTRAIEDSFQLVNSSSGVKFLKSFYFRICPKLAHKRNISQIFSLCQDLTLSLDKPGTKWRLTSKVMVKLFTTAFERQVEEALVFIQSLKEYIIKVWGELKTDSLGYQHKLILT